MKRVMQNASAFIQQEAGQTLTEYSLITLLIVLVCVAVVGLLGQTILTTLWQQASTLL